MPSHQNRPIPEAITELNGLLAQVCPASRETIEDITEIPAATITRINEVVHELRVAYSFLFKAGELTRCLAAAMRTRSNIEEVLADSRLKALGVGVALDDSPLVGMGCPF